MVHLIRASIRYVAYADQKAVVAALRPVYTAVDADAALAALVTFADSHLGQEIPGRGSNPGRERVSSGSSRSWTSVPRPGEVIYTTNSIESLNYQLRKITQEPWSGVLHVSWTVTKNRFNRTCEVKSVL